MSTVLLSCAAGRHIELQQIAAPHHRSLWPAIGQRHYEGAPDDFPRGWPLTWLKIYWLRKLLHELPDGTILVYFDADVLALKAIDLAAVLPDGFNFAAVKNVWDEYNVGVMFMRVGDEMRRIVDLTWETGPLPRREIEDQAALNIYLGGVRCHTLDARYNHYRYAKGAAKFEPNEIFIRACHGDGPTKAALTMLELLCDATI